MYTTRIIDYRSVFMIGFIVFGMLQCKCKPTTTGYVDEEKGSPGLPVQPKKRLYIFNGLWQEGDPTFKKTIEQLSADFQSQGLVVEIQVLQEPLTSKHSLDQQGQDAFNKIKNDVKNDQVSDIILVGHSQGGLRAAKVVILNDQAGRPVKIRGLITLGTPWLGATAAGITQEKVKKIIDKKPVRYLLKGINHIDPKSKQITGDLFREAFFKIYFPMHNPGVQDMVPQSAFLKQLAVDMGKVLPIPTLVIAGVNKDIQGAFKAASHSSEPYANYFKSIGKVPTILLNKFYADLFVGGCPEHDWVVPRASQLAEGIAYPFERCVIPGAVHDFIPFLRIPARCVVYNHPAAVAQIQAFVRQHFQ